MSDIILTPLDLEHLEWARELHNDPDVIKMLTDPHVVTPEEQMTWFDRLQSSDSWERVLVMIDGTPAGVVRLDQIDYYNRSIGVGLDIHKDFRGKGHAKPIYKMVLDKLFNIHHFNRVWLLVAAYNEVAINLYKGLGFVYEGSQRQALLKDGKLFDYHFMSILKSEFAPAAQEQ